MKWRYNGRRTGLGCCMVPRRFLAFLLISMTWCAALASASDPQTPAAPPISKQTRMDLLRGFNAELVYIRTPFPMGKKGLVLKNGQLSPNGKELEQMLSLWGPAVKPGDLARISNVVIKDERIRFEINGGPVKKPKWYQRITIAGNGGEAPIAPSDAEANPRGSYVDLVFDHYVPDLNAKQLKDLLHPVFDFDSKSPVEAYLETVPPKVKEAIKNHQVLVGMNRDMVLYSKGRPPKKDREKDGDVEYEEWIYGEPPQDVDFVRFVGDEVVRVETMKVGGEKILRTEKEVDIPQPTVAKGSEPQVRPPSAPSLRRPGEEVPNSSPSVMSPPGPVAPPPTDPSPSPQPHYSGGGR